MQILLIGDGAREHAIAEKLARDSDLYSIMSRKNPGIAKLSKKFWLCNLTDANEIEKIINNQQFDLGFVSPDAVLAAGISDVLIKHKIPTASPTKSAARIEWDKGFMRMLMEKYKIKGQVKHVLAKSENEAVNAIRDFKTVAIKPIGLTGGKGVKISGDHFSNMQEATAYAIDCIKKYNSVLIEEKLDGEEFSLQAFSDGKHIAIMPPVQDHKRAFEKDAGPNTGGMGSYSSDSHLPFLQQSDLEEAKQILQHAIDAMHAEGTPFKGILYGQFMAVRNGIKVIEFNARFGDPEAINVLATLGGSLSRILKDMSEGNLHQADFYPACTVVKYLVPKGYPDKPVADAPIEVNARAIEKLSAKIYYASVYEKDGKIYSSASRAVALLGVGETLEVAEKKAEAACSAVHGQLFHRKDIGTAKLINKRINHMKKLRGKSDKKQG